ncbi:MAG: MFS transporter [Chlorobi bacterium]|nr:MFS transporter [Chlorobiota bacterium]
MTSQIRTSLTWLLVAFLFMNTTQWLLFLVFIWFLNSLPETKNWFDLLYLGITILGLYWSLHGGTIVDRFPRRKLLMIAVSLYSLVLVIGTIIAFVSNSALSYVFVGLFVPLTILATIFYPSIYALGQSMVSPQWYAKLNIWIEISGQIAAMSSGLISTVLFEKFATPEKVLGVASLLFIGSVIVMLVALWKFITETYIPPKQSTASVFDRLRDAFTFLKKRPFLFIFGITSYMIFLVTLLDSFYVMPAFVDRVLNAQGQVYTFSEGLFGAGAVTVALLLWKFGTGNIPVRILILLFTVGISYVILGLMPTVALLLILRFFFGFANGGARVMRLTYLFHRVPNHLIGRVLGFFDAFNVFLRILIISFFAITGLSESPETAHLPVIFNGTILIISGIILLLALLFLQRKSD